MLLVSQPSGAGVCLLPTCLDIWKQFCFASFFSPRNTSSCFFLPCFFSVQSCENWENQPFLPGNKILSISHLQSWTSSSSCFPCMLDITKMYQEIFNW